jgi:phosphoglycolate phosphatase-like HAD superfamily hydrolase
LAKRVEDVDFEAVCNAYTRLCHERILSGDEVPGAFELMKALCDTGRVCMVNSATPQAPLRDLIEQSRFAPLVRAIYGMPGGKLHNLKQAMTSAGAQPDKTVMIGDGEDDRIAAKRAGCEFIGVASDNIDYSRNAFRCRPENTVERLDEVITWMI